VDDRQLEKSLERIKISISMEQRVLLPDTKCGDETIDRLPHGVATAPERAIVPRRLPRQVDTPCFEYRQLEQLAFHIFRGELIADALQQFAKNDVGQPETLAIEFRMNPIRLGIPDALQVIDPDGRIDDHHTRYFASRPVRDASRSPSQLTVPRKRRMLF
jgi:hypothetical protein